MGDKFSERYYVNTRQIIIISSTETQAYTTGGMLKIPAWNE